ncbi:homeobox protein cut-like 1 isoform X2 [Patella vulgata]|uniref:homeobox protein cut-like 1 isoform X2 n=1 Tax=Patella vulgata TaxID=6465 RepID=UPI0021801CA5|nr:homeobox protein cut-like 1 isoform X2 [Patella vulgata]
MAANVQSMCQFWKTFDLQDLQKELDTTATDLANKQDESDISRKRLVEQSRDFKKNTPEDIRKVVAPLLKSFQAEVDSLSKRSKSAEGAFLSVYKKLIDLPDPVTALEHALQIQKKAHRVQDLEIENKQLRETLDEYNHEFAEVKNQEVTIKQLKDKLKEHEDKLESTAESRAKEKERELQRSFAEKERQLQETQLAVAKKLGEAEQKISSLQLSLETIQSELFEAKAKHDETSTAKSDEMEMVMADLERANERAAAAEREVEQLRIQFTSATRNQSEAEQTHQSSDMEQAIDILKRSNLEVELAAKEKEIAQLVEDVQRLQASLNKLRESTASQVSALEEELLSKTKALQVLEEKLRTQDDYEEVKRELNVLKSIEFSSKEEGKGKSLEVLLLEKNKALQSENTTLKVNNTEVTGTSSPPSPSNSNKGNFASPTNEDAVQSTNTLSSKPSTPSSNGIPSDTPPVNHHLPFSPDARFPPPMAFFPFPGSPIHPSFMPLNMIKNESPLSSSGALDTSYVAKTVREILSVHNIGQRLFAKHVLGLSQGTVSELLSKPKSWDKLTEKGRESYRKMHAWSVDDRNVLALKAISPKRGSQPLVSSLPKEDLATEERIAHILNEANQAMHIKKSIEQQQVANAVVSSIYQQELSRMVGGNQSHHSSSTTPVSSVSSKVHSTTHKISGDRLSRHSVSSQESEASAEEMVSRIYRQELEKLAKAAESAGNIAASSMYQQELARLAHTYSQIKLQSNGYDGHNIFDTKMEWNVKSEPPDSTSDDMCNNNGPIDLSKHGSCSSPPSPNGELTDSRHSGSAFNLVRPRLNGHDSSENSRQPYSSESLSPLQRMQNIANSLTSRPQLGMPPSKPLRAVLPPITQEEFDNYSNVNTDDLVKKVKETLSQYSISQRLFGETVLGLSQGSVSDLLARPKPWHMLTQKGREPFIRMQLFLEDAEAIPKLVASQYRIPPDKLVRSQSRSADEQPTAHRRRKGSLDDRYFESPSQPKRPRVFFNEDQKDVLRLAYTQDPYPNQSTIEALATDLGVGVKTVINWFHNHRMRAKQQHHAGGTNATQQNGNADAIKSEPHDESSNQSEGSSLSGENARHLSGGSNSSRGFGRKETQQWMFPQFEPVKHSRHKHSSGEDEDGGSENDDINMHSYNDDDGGSDIDAEAEDEIDGDKPKCFWENHESNTDYKSNPTPQSASVNKRKRSNPQRVFEGTQLDKTETRVPKGNGAIKDSKEADGKNLSDDANNDVEENDDNDGESDSELLCERVKKIEKLQKGVEGVSEIWDDVDRGANINKLEKNIENDSSEDWEF